MSELQYADYKNLPRHKLGLMANEIWDRDPKMLGVHLARYKFVAKMLAGTSAVAEIGCGDGFCSRVVHKEVGILHLYDFDPELIAEAKRAFTHDIVKDGPLPTRTPYDAAYSLDCIEHIGPLGVPKAMRNICGSIKPDGVFICGIPSLESQQYASEASKAGHVNCMSGEDFKKLLSRYFKQVFLFSMNDEVIHTGFYPMAHYLMALCVGVRNA